MSRRLKASSAKELARLTRPFHVAAHRAGKAALDARSPFEVIAQRFGLFGKSFMNLFDLFLLSVSKVQSGQRAKATRASGSSRSMGAVSKRAARRSRRTVWASRRVLRKNDCRCR